jgi:hypothetical protein
MSWLFSQALVEEYLGASSLDGEPSVPLNGKSIPQAYCSPDKMMEVSRLSRYGMTFAPLTEDLGQELLTLFREDFHAKTLAPRGGGQALMENEAECGEKWHASFTKYDPDLSLWKTHQCSLLGDLEEFSETWPQWGLMRNGECWEQQTLERRIRGTGYGLSPNGVDSFHTPNTTGLDDGRNSRRALKKRKETWPTPQSRDWKGSSGRSLKGMECDLPTKVKMWPTPQASDNRDRGNMSNPSIQRRIAIGKQIMLSQLVDPTSGSLNPPFPEWLMGWPPGWTDLKPLATDKSHCAPQQHGES